MEKYTIQEIEVRLSQAADERDPFFLEAAKDSRKGVQELVRKWRKAKAEKQRLAEKFNEMTKFEREARKKGFSLIAGIDEAGRGPLAGPVTAAAAILPDGFFLPGIDDSKKLTARKREEYEQIIRREAIAFSISFIQPEEIDALNIYQATMKGMKAAVASLDPLPDYLLIDAVKLETPFPSEPIIKGDAKSVSIAAASILAKTARDRYMNELAAKYPGYGFESHMGYGTREHLEAIERYGITPHHRKSFSPVKLYSETNSEEN